jgi:hypothetical protein
MCFACSEGLTHSIDSNSDVTFSEDEDEVYSREGDRSNDAEDFGGATTSSGMKAH